MMFQDHETICSTAMFDLVAPPAPAVPVQVELRYHTRDPFAVLASFRTGRAGSVDWVFARDLLADGLFAGVGEGDVHIRPAEFEPDAVDIELSSPSGRAVFRAGALDIAGFLDRTYEAVAPGAESAWTNLESALEQLRSPDPSSSDPV